MRKMVSTLLCMMLFLTMILCTGCLKGLFYRRSGNLADDLYQNHYRPEIASEIAEEIIAEVFQAAREEDFSRVEVLFSNYAREKTPDLEEQFNQFCEFCSFEASDLKGTVDLTETSNYSGHYLMYLIGYEFKLEGDDTKYLLHIGWVADNVNDTSQIGIQYIEVLKYTVPKGLYNVALLDFGCATKRLIIYNRRFKDKKIREIIDSQYKKLSKISKDMEPHFNPKIRLSLWLFRRNLALYGMVRDKFGH